MDITDGGKLYLKLHAETIELLSHVDEADFLLPPRTSTGAGKPLKDRRSDGTLVRDKWKLVGFDLIPLRPNLSDERGIRIFRVSDALHIDVPQAQTVRRAVESSSKIFDCADVIACGMLRVVTTLEFLQHHFA